ncbi:MAG: 1-deoxy-D-xylulose-5-phosphate synthase [Candidatus Firestonebacteria bacterium]
MTKLLDEINSPDDLKFLNVDELTSLAQEIREEIIHTVSNTGGHLAPNLGVVELTVALHYVFNCPKDKLIWDVGHQCYTHKLLTGRKDRFGTLRQFGGISGFPRREENIYDVFNTGHASTSISSALGMAMARDLSGDNYKVLAVVGDASLSGGMAFEALNHAGHCGKDLIIVLNDNEMAISPNVGALSVYLNKIITGEFFRKAKLDVKNIILKKFPKIGPGITRVARLAEESIKGLIAPGIIFEELGFTYVGPIEGHNIKYLVETFKSIKSMKGPLLVHIITKKGKGYKPAEENPVFYHGTAPFNIKTGKPKSEDKSKTYTKIFAEELVSLAEKDKKILAITASMAEGTGLALFAKNFPDRFFDVGMAEEHAVTFAAGLAVNGYKPVVTIYSTFLQRAYDQIVHDVCIQNLPVIFVLDRAGIVPDDGATHQGIFDFSYLRHIPNIIVMAPSDEQELKKMLELAFVLNTPVAIRYPKAKIIKLKHKSKLEIGKAEHLCEGKDLAILSIGSMVSPALESCKLLEEKNISVLLVNMRFLKPIDRNTIINIGKSIKKIITVEENVLEGGFGSAVLEVLADEKLDNVKLLRLGLPDEFPEHGKRELLLEKYNLTSKGIFEQVLQFANATG